MSRGFAGLFSAVITMLFLSLSSAFLRTATTRSNPITRRMMVATTSSSTLATPVKLHGAEELLQKTGLLYAS